MSNVVRLERTTEIDYETGEIKRETSTSSQNYGKEPPYIKLYIDDLTSILKVPNAQRNVLDLMLRKLDYEGYIALSTRYKKEMAKTLSISDQSLRNNISKLVKTGIIKSSSYGEYLVNPHLFARGEWKNIVEQRKQFTMTITYNEKGKRVIKTKKEEEQLEIEI
jgi:hypothetical protein